MIFLQNHGVFVGGDSTQEIDAAYDRILSTLRTVYEKAGIAATAPETGELDEAFAFELAPKLRGWLGDGRTPKTVKTLVFLTRRIHARSYRLCEIVFADFRRSDRGGNPRI